jgi:hypothetical protein
LRVSACRFKIGPRELAKAKPSWPFAGQAAEMTHKTRTGRGMNPFRAGIILRAKSNLNWGAGAATLRSAAGDVGANTPLVDPVRARLYADTPARVAEEVFAVVEQRTAARAIRHASARLAGKTAGAAVQAGVEAGAFTAAGGEAAVLVYAVQITLERDAAATAAPGLHGGSRQQQRQGHNTEFHQSIFHKFSPLQSSAHFRANHSNGACFPHEPDETRRNERKNLSSGRLTQRLSLRQPRRAHS